MYSVLLLVLAGPPGDTATLAESLEELAALPLLVVGIGVGDADFSALQVSQQPGWPAAQQQQQQRLAWSSAYNASSEGPSGYRPPVR